MLRLSNTDQNYDLYPGGSGVLELPVLRGPPYPSSTVVSGAGSQPEVGSAGSEMSVHVRNERNSRPRRAGAMSGLWALYDPCLHTPQVCFFA